MIDPVEDEISNRIIGCAFEVSNVLGHGFLEAVYRKALLQEFRIQGLEAAEEVRLPISYKGDEIGVYVADIIVGGRVIVELKTVEALIPAHTGQVLNYLRASNSRLGMLLNFGKPRLEFKRVLL
ncbi:MAG: GxxExxY protein [Rhodospirillaceae bacterium]|nr:GxxExxY protein [Rhodospirillales bacterium]